MLLMAILECLRKLKIIMDEYLVLIEDNCYGIAVKVASDDWSVDYYVDGIRYQNLFDEDEIDFIRLLEEI